MGAITILSDDRTFEDVYLDGERIGIILRGPDGFAFVSADGDLSYPARRSHVNALGDAEWHAYVTSL